MIYVLIWWALSSGGSGAAEFNTQAACEDAKTALIASYKAKWPSSATKSFDAFCKPKG